MRYKSIQFGIHRVFPKIPRQEARQQIRKDLQDKTEALSIDTTQRNLNQFAQGIPFKPDPLRVPNGSTTPQEWDDFSAYNKNRAYAEMEASIKLREAIQVRFWFLPWVVTEPVVQWDE